MPFAAQWLPLQPQKGAGCSSARLEYASGGRVVAGSNPVIPTSLRCAFCAPQTFLCPWILQQPVSMGIKNWGGTGSAEPGPPLIKGIVVQWVPSTGVPGAHSARRVFFYNVILSPPWRPLRCGRQWSSPCTRPRAGLRPSRPRLWAERTRPPSHLRCCRLRPHPW